MNPDWLDYAEAEDLLLRDGFSLRQAQRTLRELSEGDIGSQPLSDGTRLKVRLPTGYRLEPLLQLEN